MDDIDRDNILTDIQVNSAVTREKVENMDEGLKEVREQLNGHEERISDVESKTSRNSFILTGVASTVGATIAAVGGKLAQWF